jgi:hypothetical protein
MSELFPVVYDFAFSDYVNAQRTNNHAWMSHLVEAVGAENIFILGHTAQRLLERDIEVVFTTPDMVIDTTPGTGRFVTRGPGLSNAEERELLSTYAPGVRTLVPVDPTGSIPELAEDKQSYVLKNSKDEGGDNKLLFETEEQLEKLAAWLVLNADAIRADGEFYLEPFVKGTGDFMHSYRFTAIASGQIIAAAFKYAGPSSNGRPVVTEPLLRPFVDPKHPLYLNTRSITSNSATGGETVALSTPNHSVLGELSSEEQQILELHGITGRQAPEAAFSAAVRIAKVLGPSQGLITGIDLIQSSQGDFYFLESQQGPSLDNARKTLGRHVTDLEIYLRAADSFAATYS